MRRFLNLIFYFLILHLVLVGDSFAQKLRGDRTFRKVGIHNGNL
ncbi:hypothetical protein JGI25_01411, partial [Candidatus Kryptobacter tengchongensis]